MPTHDPFVVAFDACGCSSTTDLRYSDEPIVFRWCTLHARSTDAETEVSRLTVEEPDPDHALVYQCRRCDQRIRARWSTVIAIIRQHAEACPRTAR